MRNNWKNVIFLVLFLLFCSIKTSSSVITFECIDVEEDFTEHKWKSDPKILYASSSKYLPHEFQDEPGLQGDGIFYFEGSNSQSNKLVLKTGDLFVNESPAFIYVKYYAHVEVNNTNSQRAYVTPVLRWDGVKLQKLQLTSDYQWQEEYFEIHLNDISSGVYYALQVGIFDFEEGDFLFIDKIQIVQGIKITDINEFSTYCSHGNGTTTTTTTTTAATTTTVNETTSSATTESESETKSTSTPKPTTSQPGIIECIDDRDHFSYYDWISDPPFKYADTSFDLPDLFHGNKLVGRGIFYFEGNSFSFSQRIIKILSIATWKSPSFLYIKFYVHAMNNLEPVTAYVAPVVNEDWLQFGYLNASSVSEFEWREKLFEIDVELAQEGGIEISLGSLAPKDSFLFIDQIFLMQGTRIKDVDDIRLQCSAARK